MAWMVTVLLLSGAMRPILVGWLILIDTMLLGLGFGLFLSLVT